LKDDEIVLSIKERSYPCVTNEEGLDENRN